MTVGFAAAADIPLTVGISTEYQYDSLSQLLENRSPTRTIHYQYDPNGNLIRRWETLSGE
jgi:uncharacterized protein RhaS with RHS repeats